MKSTDMRAKLESIRLAISNACDVYRREPSDQRVCGILTDLCDVVKGLIDGQDRIEKVSASDMRFARSLLDDGAEK